ncbi:hypothetical protein [Saccharopolyspora endophytica]|uniref:Uncharacterized protein n=1 Tax=Saccharopolyspora endophytica TaxID=543886 RepID=A0ABS5DDI7_9PSEU|nr:hypothetical protein [Saccharopolyspora endophytica]MBQ0924300.1 hypothetical protein [Saccharopolyspora endophytica]
MGVPLLEWIGVPVELGGYEFSPRQALETIAEVAALRPAALLPRSARRHPARDLGTGRAQNCGKLLAGLSDGHRQFLDLVESD